MAKRRSSRRRQSEPDSPEVRLEATRALGHATRNLKALRTLYIIDACIVGMIGLFALGLGGTNFSIGCGVIAIIAIIGAVRVVQHPVAWTMGLAIVHTLWALVAAVPLAMGFVNLNSIAMIGIALALWGAVSMARSTMQILEEFPDVWAAKRMRGEGRDRSEMGSRHQEAARKRQRMRLLKIVGAIGAVVLLFVIIALWPKGDKPHRGSSSGITGRGGGAGGGIPTVGPEASAASLESAWNGEGFEGVIAMVAESEQPRLRRLLAKVLRRRKWDVKNMPTMSGARIEPYDETHVYSHHAIKDYGSLRASWEWEHDKWVVVRVKLKKD